MRVAYGGVARVGASTVSLVFSESSIFKLLLRSVITKASSILKRYRFVWGRRSLFVRCSSRRIVHGVPI